MATDTSEPGRAAVPVPVAGALDFIGVDFRLDLRLTDGSSVQLESAFIITDRSGGSVVVDPERKDSLLAILRLFGTDLDRRSVEGDTLTLFFADGATLVAGPDGESESWHVSGPKGRPVRVDPLEGSTSPGTEEALRVRVPGPSFALDIAGDTVDCIGLESDVTIRFSSGASLRFETDFALTGSDGEHAFLDPGDKPSLLTLLALHTEVVSDGAIEGGRIAIRFASGALLEGWANRRGPSWHYSEPGRARVDVDAMTDGEVRYRHSPSSAEIRR
ncbi:hypothetical protein EDF42_1451 [Curtobacterium sp. PhB172]|uniref:DUF6188 family protein n=1 Tax=Curtobacterium sp. PhB170 TaxID=2485194 RepID=UPI000FA42A0C|nr:DUF6188 family protein [Curtobacterium sp. PhB170]ROQ06101.1 hypothetical protein EDF41_2915 [Curtobacterium sp. PhB171]ROS34296.1 hypothetical protein EDF25_2738 [Curtobacterium sp. PhB131]ROS67419.1 hypothetical protein EDF42_1451 [Curtobacterium sp. PhB172]ROS74236.1 hypothetical protein EDF30_0008 [Curtobacterium sp. PhB141]ROQ22752.1 hypothetical protein EDF40_2757 [Curtobacterium sp. PhB170]